MAEASWELVEIPATDFSSLIPQLSREECDGFLCRFAQGDTTAGMELKKRLLSLIPCQPTGHAVRLSFGELMKRANEILKARQMKREKVARRKHSAEMKALASREAETWREVESLVEMKQPRHCPLFPMPARLFGQSLDKVNPLKAIRRTGFTIPCVDVSH